MRHTGILAIAMLAAGCSGTKPAAAPQADTPIAVNTAIVSPAAGASSLDIAGTVRLKRETVLSFSTGGSIAAIAVREGDVVRPGQLLARLDTSSLAAQRESASAEAARAAADYKRMVDLAAKGWITATRLEQARATEAAARARVAQTGLDVRLATLAAQTGGVILKRSAEPGQIASPGSPVLTLGEYSSGYVFRVPMADSDMGRVKLGQLAAVSIPALGPQPIAATVSEIGARGDDGTGTYRVEFRLPANTALRSGLIGRATLHIGGEGPANGPVTVPASAVFGARADEGFVYVLDGTRVRLRPVSIGPVGDRATTILSGLKPGERVVTSGADRLRDGLAVRVAS
jgi:RND family efflux transporter MFP subunit